MTETFTVQEEQEIRTYFFWSVLIKGVISLAEVLAGVAAIFIPVTLVTSTLVTLTQFVFSGSIETIFVAEIMKIGGQLAELGSGFIAFYLLSRGLIKLGLVVALLKERLWAYPWSLIVLSAFVVYQLYELYFTHSGGIIIITIFDFIVMWFIWKEWCVVTSHHEV